LHFTKSSALLIPFHEGFHPLTLFTNRPSEGCEVNKHRRCIGLHTHQGLSVRRMRSELMPQAYRALSPRFRLTLSQRVTPGALTKFHVNISKGLPPYSPFSKTPDKIFLPAAGAAQKPTPSPAD
jgi:hypothetical protein